jgi:hypothetical protein
MKYPFERTLETSKGLYTVLRIIYKVFLEFQNISRIVVMGKNLVSEFDIAKKINTKTQKRLKSTFLYYKVSFLLTSEMLGTVCKGSVYDEYVLKKAEKMIKKANSVQTKLTKELDKYAGYPLTENKQFQELSGIVRRYQEMLAKKEPIPEKPEELRDYIDDLELELDEMINRKDQKNSTGFFRVPKTSNDPDMQKIIDQVPKEYMSPESTISYPMISTHMVLGNFKENSRIVVLDSTLAKADRLLPTKVSVGRMFALDVKPVEEFMVPSKDILREEDGKPKLMERIVRIERMGQTETAITLSEVLPKGTEMSCTLRIRSDSLFVPNSCEKLRYLLDLGKSNGLGQWRGSGCKGQYYYKLEKVENPEVIPEGWS